MMKILIEALCVGIASLFVGLLLHVLLGHHALHEKSPTMKVEMMRLSTVLFLTGFVIHLSFEFLKLNKWYCKNGNACKTK